MAEQVKDNMWVSIWKGVRHFLISLAVLILAAVIQGLSNFHPEPGIQLAIWSALSAVVIGGVTSLMNWLKNKDVTTTVEKTANATITTTVKPT